jgi:hypothetical protein
LLTMSMDTPDRDASVAEGRMADIESPGLERARINSTAKGISVDAHMRIKVRPNEPFSAESS